MSATVYGQTLISDVPVLDMREEVIGKANGFISGVLAASGRDMLVSAQGTSSYAGGVVHYKKNLFGNWEEKARLDTAYTWREMVSFFDNGNNPSVPETGRAIAFDGSTAMVSSNMGIVFYEQNEAEEFQIVSRVPHDSLYTYLEAPLAVSGEMAAATQYANTYSIATHVFESDNRLAMFIHVAGDWQRTTDISFGEFAPRKLSLAGTTLVVSLLNGLDSTSENRIYEHGPTGWVESAKLRDGATLNVLPHGSTLAVGVNKIAAGFLNAGTGMEEVRIFSKDPGGQWVEEQKIIAPVDSRDFGKGVSWLGDTLIVSSEKQGAQTDEGFGQTFLFYSKSNGIWQPIGRAVSRASYHREDENENTTLFATSGGDLIFSGGAHSNTCILQPAVVSQGVVIEWGAATSSPRWEGSDSVIVSAFLSQPADVSLTVPIEVSGTAAEGHDFDLGAQELTFQPGERIASLEIALLTDQTLEADETIILGFGTLPANLSVGQTQTSSLTIHEPDAEFRPRAYIDANEPSLMENDWWHNASSLANDGNLFAVGNPGLRNRGVVYVYEKDNLSRWIQTSSLRPDPAISGGRFGESLALNGSVLAVGMPGFNRDGLTMPGHVLLYRRSATGNWVERARIEDPSGQKGSDFGAALALFNGWLFVGAPASQGGGKTYGWQLLDGAIASVEPLTLNAPLPGRFGCAIALETGRLVIGAEEVYESGNQVGAAWIYEWNGTTWQQKERLIPPAQARRGFGHALSISEGRVVAGAPLSECGSGCAVIFQRQPDGSWPGLVLSRPLFEPDLFFGTSVAIKGDDILVSSNGWLVDGDGSKLTSYHRGLDGVWSQRARFGPHFETVLERRNEYGLESPVAIGDGEFFCGRFFGSMVAVFAPEPPSSSTVSFAATESYYYPSLAGFYQIPVILERSSEHDGMVTVSVECLDTDVAEVDAPTLVFDPRNPIRDQPRDRDIVVLLPVSIVPDEDDLSRKPRQARIRLTSVNGANVGHTVEHTINILDEDTPPGVGVTSLNVQEGIGPWLSVKDQVLATYVEDGVNVHRLSNNSDVIFEQKLTPPIAGDAATYFGMGLIVTGGQILAASGVNYFGGPTESVAGTIFTYSKVAATWVHQQTLQQAGYPYFGSAMASDGVTLVVSSLPTVAEDKRGVEPVFVYRRSEATDQWQIEQVIAPPSVSGFFGRSLAVDGDWLAIVDAPDNMFFGGYSSKIMMYHRNGNGFWDQIVEFAPSRLGAVFSAVAISNGKLYYADDDGIGSSVLNVTNLQNGPPEVLQTINSEKIYSLVAANGYVTAGNFGRTYIFAQQPAVLEQLAVLETGRIGAVAATSEGFSYVRGSDLLVVRHSRGFNLNMTALSVDESQASGEIEVVLPEPYYRDTFVAYDLLGSARVGADFTVTASPVIISSGQIRGFISLMPKSDSWYEGVETVRLSLVPNSDFPVGHQSDLTVTIRDDDVPAHAPVVEQTEANVFTIERSPYNGAEVTHFRLAKIKGVTVRDAGGQCMLPEGAFVTVAHGEAGLTFCAATWSHGAAGLGW
jgi:hypothetical protein